MPVKLVCGFAILLLIVFIVIMALLVYSAQQSTVRSRYVNNLSAGLEQLKPCSAKPNCVCSEYTDSEQHYIAPLSYTLSNAAMMKKIIDVVNNMQGNIIEENENYLAAEFSSAFFGFIDDVEIRLDSHNKLVHLRSASRQGYSDFNKNRERIMSLKQSWQ